jgi:regulator of sigma E protease
MISTILVLILAILIALVAITFLVTIHEFGHFLTAKYFKVKVEEFGIGFPFPGRIWGKKIGETLYTINWLPAGGFVRLFGEDEDEKHPRSFSSKPAWQRATIIVAGVVVNIVFAFVLFSFLLGFSGWKTEIPLIYIENQFPFGHQENQIFISEVEKDSPAASAGLASGDIIMSIDGEKVDEVAELQESIKEKQGQPVQLTIRNTRNDSEKDVVAIPRVDPPEGQGRLGVAGLGVVAVLSYPSLAEKVLVGPMHSANMIQYQDVVLKSLFTKSVSEGTVEPVRQNVSGVLGIVGFVILLINSFGFGALVPLLTIMALLSLLLGIINVLPLPAVDGGRLFFVLFELITRKKMNATAERWIHTVGFGLLLILFVLVTVNDIPRLFGIITASFK